MRGSGRERHGEDNGGSELSKFHTGLRLAREERPHRAYAGTGPGTTRQLARVGLLRMNSRAPTRIITVEIATGIQTGWFRDGLGAIMARLGGHRSITQGGISGSTST
ncbi:MAG: hypothetical protein ACRENJ_09030 [Candidatus Eiseniibacteriota bacterium]